MRELALFAGIGGGILGGKRLGWKTVCAVENNEYARNVLVARQNDGSLTPFPIWDDVQTFDGRPWKGIIDVVSGGFPCQGISAIGKGQGLRDSRSGLWSEMSRIIGEVAPDFVFVENSPNLRTRGLGVVLADLARMGYNAVWGVIGANAAGLAHIRKRMWIVAYSASGAARLATEREGWENTTRRSANCRRGTPSRRIGSGKEPARLIPRMGRMANEFSGQVDRLKTLGNAQSPAQARLAWEILTGCVRN